MVAAFEITTHFVVNESYADCNKLRQWIVLCLCQGGRENGERAKEEKHLPFSLLTPLPLRPLKPAKESLIPHAPY